MISFIGEVSLQSCTVIRPSLSNVQSVPVKIVDIFLSIFRRQFNYVMLLTLEISVLLKGRIAGEML